MRLQCVIGRIILRCLLNKAGSKILIGLDSFGLGMGRVASTYEHGNEPTSSTREGNFLNSSISLISYTGTFDTSLL
jgi:hypothetical protein